MTQKGAVIIYQMSFTIYYIAKNSTVKSSTKAKT